MDKGIHEKNVYFTKVRYTCKKQNLGIITQNILQETLNREKKKYREREENKDEKGKEENRPKFKTN